MAAATPRSPNQTAPARPPNAPAFIMGLGLGGFVDGIVLHQILQWHHMLSDTGDNPMTTVAGLESNTLADGLFHLATWLLVAVAMTLTVTAWRDGKLAPPWTAHFGMLLAGWDPVQRRGGRDRPRAPRFAPRPGRPRRTDRVGYRGS